jgi:hypothetical protein
MFEDKVCKVFTESYWDWIISGLGWTGPKYDPRPFEKLLKVRDAVCFRPSAGALLPLHTGLLW